MHNVPIVASGQRYSEIIKLQIWEEADMTKDGYLHWNPKLRPFIAKRTFTPKLRIDASVWDIDTIQKLASVVYENCGASKEGCYWVVFRLSKGKTRTHWKWVQIAKLRILSRGDGWTFMGSGNFRYNRSWYVRLAKTQIHAENYEEGGEEDE